MPTITLNGQPVEVAEGLNLIKAAEQAGVHIPHYCYHPGLPIDGNCRMCLVEVEGARGPQIACNTPIKDGMVVRTDTPAVEKMRQGVQEFLLLNHPIDCPICDQAGECRLQDYYMEFGQYENRSQVPKVEKAKVVDLGPLVVLDQERCIVCQRCVRFTDAVTKTGELVVMKRGEQGRITTFPGKPLDNPYSGNVVDICPVGALTSKDFRFKQRVWFLSTTSSVCTGCARGCNITVDHRDGETYRYKPRHHPDVNQYWMCDAGRLSYKATNENRLTTARLEGRTQPLGTVLDATVSKLKSVLETYGPESVVVVGSAHATVEANFVVKRLATEVVKTPHLFGVTLTPDWEGDDFLKQSDRTPNRKGLELLGLSQDARALEALLAGGKVRMLVVVDNDLVGDGGAAWAELVSKVPVVVALSTHQDATAAAAQVVFPVATHVEQFGSFVQAQGILQKIMKAYDPAGDAAASWEILGALARALGTEFDYADLEQIWADMRQSYPVLGEMTFYGLPATGMPVATAELVGR